MATSKKMQQFDHIDNAVLTLVQDNIAWGVANFAVRKIVASAKLKFEMADGVLTEDTLNMSAYKKTDTAYKLLVEAVNVIDGATLDGVSTNLIDAQIERELETQFKLQLPKGGYDFERQAFDELEMESDEFFLMEPEDQAPLVKARNRQLIMDAKRRAIAARDAKLEYADVSKVLADNMTNPRSEGLSITSDGNFEEYLEIRGKALVNRIKNLRSRSAKVDDEWINRYDFNGNPIPGVSVTLAGYIELIINEGIRLRYTMPEAPRSQAAIDEQFAKLKAVS